MDVADVGPGTWRAGLAATGVVASLLAFVAPPAFAATETVGSSQTRTPSTPGPCGQTNCVVFQSEAGPGATNTPTAAGQVTEISVRKGAGALNIQPVVISGPLTGATSYTLESIGDTIALNPAESTQSYPLTTPLAIDPGDTVGIRYPDGPASSGPYLLNYNANARPTRANGGSITRIGNTTGGPGVYPPSIVLANYDLLTRYTVTRIDGPVGAPYDLAVEATPHNYTVRSFQGKVQVRDNTTGSYVPETGATVQNLGPSSSEPTFGTEDVVGFGAEASLKPQIGCSLATTSEVRCFFDSIAPGRLIDVPWSQIQILDPLSFVERLPVDIGFIARVDCNQAREPCENNSSENTLSFAGTPRSEWNNPAADGLSGAAGPPLASGAQKASGGAAISEVEIAVLKLDGKLKGFSGDLPGPDAAAARASKAAQCLWLKNKKAKFAKSAPNGKLCDDPVWLKAKGTSKWSYKLSKPLPDGNYVAYARATTSDGGVEFFFAKSEKNRIEFTLKD